MDCIEKNLEKHHIRFVSLGEENTEEDLAVVCASCHSLIHRSPPTPEFLHRTFARARNIGDEWKKFCVDTSPLPPTEEQAVEGVSLQSQETKIAAYCQMHGLDLIGIIADEGTSAARSLSQRQGEPALLKTVESGDVSHVVVLRLDRLFRRAKEALNESEEWDKQQIELHLIDQTGTSISTRNSLGRFSS